MKRDIAPEMLPFPTGPVGPYVCVFFVLFLLTFSPGGPVAAEATAPEKYSPSRIAGGLLVKPGTMSWAPDGKRIAFIGGTLTVYDTETGKRKELAINDPLFVNWGTGDEIFLLYRENGKNLLCAVDAVTSIFKS